MPSVSLRLTDAQVSWLDAQTRQFRNRSDVLRDLIDSQIGNLDSPGTLIKPSPEGGKVLSLDTPISKESPISNNTLIGGSKGEEKKDPYKKKTLGDDLIPNDLLDCDQLLREFWSVKKGGRSERVFNRVINKLRKWTPAVRRSALEAAANAEWPDVYEPRQPGGRQQQQATDWDALEKSLPKF
tara:strand:+ start:1161 stop:1709 length:549 start_codon:yes stop_codon:yes gene_type:complete